MENIKRNLGIDILKALSVISVIVYHLYEFRGTYIGVIVFFVISGYFITAILNEREESYLNFILKRFSKIYPMLTAVLATICLIFFMFNGFLTEKIIYSSLSSFFGVSNIYQILSGLSYFERSGDMFPLLHTWTLSIEIQFYVFYPFLIYFLKKIKTSNEKNTIILICLSLVSVLIMSFKAQNNYDINNLYYGTDTRIFSLFVGGAYYFCLKDREIDKKKINILAILSAIIIVSSVFYVNYLMDINYKGLLYFLSILSGIIVIAIVKADFLNYDNKILKILANLGKHSYCYYLWQYPIMIFMEEYFKWSDIKYNYSVAIQVVILVIISEISYIFLEERVNMAKKLQKIFFIIYVGLLFFLPISQETNSKTVEDRINEVDLEMQLKKIEKAIEIEKKEVSDDLEKRLLDMEEEITEESAQIEKTDIDEKLSEQNLAQDLKTDEDKKEEKNEEIKKEVVKKEKMEEAEKEAGLTDEKEYTFIGDSVMKMGEPYIKEIFKNSNVDAKVSRQFVNLPKLLEELQKEGSLKDIVVVHLGTNGVMNKESFTKSMELLKDKKVFFMNCVVPKFWEDTINENLEEWSKDYNNVKLIDWHKKAKGQKELFYKDATHPKPEGAKKYAEFIYESVN